MSELVGRIVEKWSPQARAAAARARRRVDSTDLYDLPKGKRMPFANGTEIERHVTGLRVHRPGSTVVHAGSADEALRIARTHEAKLGGGAAARAKSEAVMKGPRPVAIPDLWTTIRNDLR